jgi:hypothetical protein
MKGRNFISVCAILQECNKKMKRTVVDNEERDIWI